jgi:glycerol uptake facilitator protein
VSSSPTLLRKCAAEAAGTFILVFFGVGAVHAAVLAGTLAGAWQVAVVWAVGVSLAVYAAGAVSGAHLNPAITAAMTLFRRFPLRHAGPYVASQLVGAFLAAATLNALYSGPLHEFEKAGHIVRSRPGSGEYSAMVYGEYFPNPATAKAMKWNTANPPVSELQAMLGEGVGTAFLAFFVFAVTDARGRTGRGSRLVPLFIGLTVAVVISVIAPLTQAGLNPARDFGPRLFSYFLGWGRVAIPGPRGGFFTVYILAPILGAVAGAALYQRLWAPARMPQAPPSEPVAGGCEAR